MIILKVVLFAIVILLVIFGAFVGGYKLGKKDEALTWVEKEDYYKWLLEVEKKKEWLEEEKPKAAKPNKKIVKGYSKTCEFCGAPIKKGAVCAECKKEGY